MFIKVFIFLTILFFITTIICSIVIINLLNKIVHATYTVNSFDCLFNNIIRYLNSFMSEEDTKKILYNALKLQCNTYNASLPENYLEDMTDKIYEEVINDCSDPEGVIKCR